MKEVNALKRESPDDKKPDAGATKRATRSDGDPINILHIDFIICCEYYLFFVMIWGYFIFISIYDIFIWR